MSWVVESGAGGMFMSVEGCREVSVSLVGALGVACGDGVGPAMGGFPAVSLSSSITMGFDVVVVFLSLSSLGLCFLVPPFIPMSTSLKECSTVGEGMKARLLLVL